MRLDFSATSGTASRARPGWAPNCSASRAGACERRPECTPVLVAELRDPQAEPFQIEGKRRTLLHEVMELAIPDRICTIRTD